ncbi:MAG: nucleotide-binding protein [Candidatus Bathyarchaeota archaeon]|nr:nucleotide-binding protein [Candidatus Termiticorpusculum sp.]
MDFKVFLDSTDSRIKRYVDVTIEKINVHSSEFHLVDMRNTIDNQTICTCIQKNSSNTSSDNTERIMYEQAKTELSVVISDWGKCVIITDKPFFDNWFSHCTDNFWFVTVSEWERDYAPPHVDKFLQYDLIQFFAWCGADMDEDQMRKFGHINSTVDCIFDVCVHKADIKISMRSGRICPDCRRKLLDFGLSVMQLQAIDVLLKIMSKNASYDKVFIVHGHGTYKDTVARYIESLGLTPVILSEQDNQGRTIIEKFEAYSDVDFAIVLYTPDDIGGVITKPSDLRSRARQNVVFEHGYFTAKLGRKNIVVLLKNDVEKLKIETAGDNDGIVYIPLDDNNCWKEQIKRELRASGYNVT